MILLKRDVYRHLLFNRGAGARRLSTRSKSTESEGVLPVEDVERQREKVRTVYAFLYNLPA